MSSFIDFGKKDDSYTVFQNSPTACNSAQEQEVNDLLEFLKLEQGRYLQQKIIYDLIEDLIYTDNVDPYLKRKVKDIIVSENLKQTSSIDKQMLLLGVNNDDTVLTYSESSSLQDMVKTKLSEAPEDLAASHHSWTELIEGNSQLNLIPMNSDDKVLLDYRNKLNAEQEKYADNLINLNTLLEDMTNLRLVDLPNVLKDKVKECELEQKNNHLKCIIAQKKSRVDVFTETSCSLKAYKELIKDIQEQQKDCQKEISHLEELKEKYKQVSGKQYDDILKSYLQYKSSVERKKMLYDCLKK